MLEIRKLKNSEWSGLTGIFDKVFDASMPSPEHSEILGAFEDGRLEGFILLETAVFVAEFYSRSKENNGRIARRLIQYARQHVPDKQGVGAIANEKRFEMLFKTLGLSEIPGKLFWRNAK